MSHKARKHLQNVDSKLYGYIEKNPLIPLRKSRNFFSELCDTIISQQLSGKAAATIFGRFKNLFPKKNITAQALFNIPDEKIRECGASWAKVRSLKDLAAKVDNKTVNLDKLDHMSNEDVINTLVQIKGIGPWSAEMFLIFALGREDVFSFGDLGLKKGIIKVYGLKEEPSIKQIEMIVSRWKPYRTYASRVLWKSLELK